MIVRHDAGVVMYGDARECWDKLDRPVYGPRRQPRDDGADTTVGRLVDAVADRDEEGAVAEWLELGRNQCGEFSQRVMSRQLRPFQCGTFASRPLERAQFREGSLERRVLTTTYSAIRRLKPGFSQL